MELEAGKGTTKDVRRSPAHLSTSTPLSLKDKWTNGMKSLPETMKHCVQPCVQYPAIRMFLRISLSQCDQHRHPCLFVFVFPHSPSMSYIVFNLTCVFLLLCYRLGAVSCFMFGHGFPSRHPFFALASQAPPIILHHIPHACTPYLIILFHSISTTLATIRPVVSWSHCSHSFNYSISTDMLRQSLHSSLIIRFPAPALFTIFSLFALYLLPDHYSYHCLLDFSAPFVWPSLFSLL